MGSKIYRKISLQNNNREEWNTLDKVSLKQEIKIEYDDIVEKLNEVEQKSLINLQTSCDDVLNSESSRGSPEILLENEQRCGGQKRTTVANAAEKVQNTESEKKIYQKKLGTCEILFVYLIRENLEELQKQKYQDDKLSGASHSFKSKWMKLLEKRFDGHRGQMLFKCLFCDLESTYLANIERHINNIHEAGIELLQCDKCAYQTKSKHNFNRHLILHSGLDELPVYKCDICSFRTVHKVSMPRHKLTHHTPGKMVSCTLCDYKGKSKGHLASHHHYNHKKFDESKMHKCKKCPYKTKYSSNLNRHSLNHKSDNESTFFLCHLCNFRFTRKVSLVKHMKHIHPQGDVERFTCSKCDFQTKYKPNLKQHLLYKHNDGRNKLKCTLCSFESTNPKSLRYHMQKHKIDEDTREYSCPDCSYKGKSELLLNTHRIVHKNLKEGRVYKCEQCPYQTRMNGNIKRHKRQVHGKNIIQSFLKCHKCEYQSTRKGYLKLHYNNVHGGYRSSVKQKL